MIIKEAGSKLYKVRLDKDDEQALETEMERNGYETKAGMIRGLIRGMHTEFHRLGDLHSDLRLPSVLVELVDRLEYHRAKCGENCPHAMQEYVFIFDRYRLRFNSKRVPKTAPKKGQEDSSTAVRIPYSPSTEEGGR